MAKRGTKKAELLTDMEDNMKCLKELVKDERCLDVLSQKLDEFNVFDVLKSTHHELKHSNVIAWLLNPHGSHLMYRCLISPIMPNALKMPLPVFT